MNAPDIKTAGASPEDSTAEVVYRRWLVGLFDGLLSLDMRASAEDQLLAHVRARPVLFAVFVSGVVTDLVRSLPAEDPWRHTGEVEGMVQSVRGDPFGTWADATDLQTPGHPDVKSDANLAALSSPLTPSAALVIHLAAQGWDAVCEHLSAAVCRGTTAEELFSDGAAAIRWAVHRRRVYTGADDPYASVVTASWVRRAQRVEHGQPWDEARRARLAIQEKVADGLYQCFARQAPANGAGHREIGAPSQAAANGVQHDRKDWRDADQR